MKKFFKCALPLLLAAVMLISSAPFSALLTLNATATEYKVGDIVEFGSYPQSEVTDTATLSALNSLSLNWVSYGYYSGNVEEGSMVQSDYMKYADTTHNGTKYRAVKFTEYRPYWTYYVLSELDSFQDDNGYNIDTTYWFKYEPIKWRVLDPNEGFLLSETIIDSQAYSNTIYDGGEYFYNDSSYTNYANDYATSSIRKWLNDDFYNTAFTSDQQTGINTTTLDNSAYSDEYSQYDSATTGDKVFLLSWDEVQNTSYGFDASTDSSATREAGGSDYAKCQGLWVNTDSDSDYYGNSNWHLRSPGRISESACKVMDDGYVYYYSVYNTTDGVRPALKITNLTSLSPAAANDGTAGGGEDGSENIFSAVKNFTSGLSMSGIIVGIALGVVITVIVMKKKNPRESNTAMKPDTEEKSDVADKPVPKFTQIISYAPLSDEQLEALNQNPTHKN